MGIPPASNTIPRWQGLVLSACGLFGGVAAAVIGLLVFAIHLVPDTGRGEDITVMGSIAVLIPFLVLSAFLRIGAGLGGFALMPAGQRRLPAIAILLALSGIVVMVATLVTWI